MRRLPFISLSLCGTDLIKIRYADSFPCLHTEVPRQKRHEDSQHFCTALLFFCLLEWSGLQIAPWTECMSPTSGWNLFAQEADPPRCQAQSNRSFPTPHIKSVFLDAAFLITHNTADSSDKYTNPFLSKTKHDISMLNLQEEGRRRKKNDRNTHNSLHTLWYTADPMLMEQSYQSSAKILINSIYKPNIDQIKTQVKRWNIYDAQNYRL